MRRASEDFERRLGLPHQCRLTGSAEPMLLLLHGSLGNLNSMSIFATKAPRTFNLLSPQGTVEEEAGKYSWWARGSQSAEQREEAADNILRFLHRAAKAYDLSGPFLACGFSQGAALLSVCIQKSPQIFAAAALLCGCVPRHGVSGKLSLPVLIIHGEADHIIPIGLAEKGAEYLRENGAAVSLIMDKTGHKVGSKGMEELRRWLAAPLRRE